MSRTPDPSIGDRIRIRRQARGWSVRFAADRARLAASSWSRIERGLRGADNRYVLADIAAALECSVTELTGQPALPTDRGSAEAQAAVDRIRRALVEADLSEEAGATARPIGELTRETDLVADLRRRCDYTGVGRLVPHLITELHAAALGSDRGPALHLLTITTHVAAATLRNVGYPAEAWLAAERCRQAAQALEDPVMLGYADFERAHSAIGCGSYERGLRLAVRAADALAPAMAAPDAAEMMGMLHLTVAFAAIGAHQPGDAPERVAEAERLAARTGDTDTLNLMFGPENIKFWKIAMEVDGGEPALAVRIAEQTNPARVNSPNRQVAFYTDLARALTRVRRDEQAIQMLLTAERLSPIRVRNAPLPRETARTLLERSRRSAARSKLAGLCERMALTM